MVNLLDDDLNGNKENQADLGSTDRRPGVQQPSVPDASNATKESVNAVTASDQDSNASRTQNLKAKRSTLFYPSPNFQSKSNQKPFSSSAAKRESVMALGSIGHLQSFYARQGFAAPEPPTAKGAGRLALGPAALANLSLSNNDGSATGTLSMEGGTGDTGGSPLDALAALEGRQLPGQSQQDLSAQSSAQAQMPQSTWKGRLPPDIPKPVEADLSRLWDGMIQALDETCQMWDLLGQIKVAPLRRASRAIGSNEGEHSGRPSLDVWSDSLGDANDGNSRRFSRISDTSRMSTSCEPVDILQLINSTTVTVRSVRNYLFALPPAPLPPRRPEEDTTTATAGKTLRKKPSTQFGEEHVPGVKPKDAFKRQSSFHGLPRGGNRRPSSVLGSSGFLAPSGPSSSSHPPSSFAPFEMVSRRASRDGEQLSSSNQGHRPQADEQSQSPSDLQRTGQAQVGKGFPSTTSHAPTQGTESDNKTTDPLVVVRTAALEVLGMLRELEERARIPKQGDGSGKEGDGMPSHESVKMMRNYSEASASSGTSMQAPAEDVDDEVEGFLYQSDLTLAQLEKERENVKRYLSTVDGVLSEVAQHRSSLSKSAKAAAKGLTAESLSSEGRQRSALERRSASESVGAGHGGDSRIDALHAPSVDLDENSLPEWARLAFEGDAIVRARALLCEVLPEMAEELSPPPGVSDGAWREKFLAELSDGQVLCHGYNGALRRSARPWGFIQSSSVHDVKAEEEAYYEALGDKEKETADGAGAEAGSGSGASTRRPGWTFRRAENLKRFCAAIALRYNVRGATASPTFEAVEVARREGNWERMLEGVVGAWVSKVIEEERSC